ncbi:MAG: HTTM domain-containing protein [Planctomycetaceae bacterium]
MNSAVRNTIHNWYQSFQTGVRAWTEFWFAPADPFMLGVIRILTGWMLVYNLLVWGIDLQAFFGVNGLQPLQTILDFHASSPVFSLWFYVPAAWIPTVHWICVGIAALFFLGVGTRVTSILAYLITISYSQRVPVANFGLDQILGLLCLYLAIGPSGACLSFDAWWKNRKARQQGITLPVPASSSARVALRMIQLHLCVIYFWAGYSKLKGDSWFSGEAMWQAMANQEYQTMDLTGFAWLPWVPYLIAHVTIIWEVYFCVAIWNRTLRPLWLLIGAGMHFGIGAFMGMWTFGLIMTFAYFSFSDPEKWRRRFAWAQNSIRDLFAEPPLPELLQEEPLLTEVASQAPVATLSVPSGTPSRSSAVRESNAAVAVAAPAKFVATPANSNPSVSPAPETLSSPTEPESVLPPVRQAPAPAAPELVEQADDPPAVQGDFPEADASGGNWRDFRATQLPEPAGEIHDDPADERPRINTPVIKNRFRRVSPRSMMSAFENVEIHAETALLLVALNSDERNTLRKYFREVDIVCRAASSADAALTLAMSMKPMAVVVAGTLMKPDELVTVLDDLNDITTAPMIALTTDSQSLKVAEDCTGVHLLHYPVSPVEIRETLQKILFGDGSVESSSGHHPGRLSDVEADAF